MSTEVRVDGERSAAARTRAWLRRRGDAVNERAQLRVEQRGRERLGARGDGGGDVGVALDAAASLQLVSVRRDDVRFDAARRVAAIGAQLADVGLHERVLVAHVLRELRVRRRRVGALRAARERLKASSGLQSRPSARARARTDLGRRVGGRLFGASATRAIVNAVACERFWREERDAALARVRLQRGRLVHAGAR